MGYAALILGIIGLFGCTWIFLKVDPRRALYDWSLLGYVLSWVVMVYGVWQVLA